ncbi:MAG TPA: substrate-binding domain-containing protein [Anseongella sp.]|nr:substrate-binding domain-containing protein [Anseongella sp.]
MPPKKISIRDIARQLGVSSTTVSFVLNGKQKEKRISDKVAKSVTDLARKLKYEPNHMARGLRTGKTKTIGLIVEDISNHFFAHIAKVVERRALKYGYRVLYCSTEDNAKKAKELLHMLKYRQVDGFIITPTASLEKEISLLLDEHRPVVLIDRYLPGLPVSYVIADNFTGAYQAVLHLIGEGYRKIGFVTTTSSQMQMKSRFEGYKQALSDHRISYEPALVLKIPFSGARSNAPGGIMELLNKQTPEALFFATNYLGICGIEGIKKLGMKIPSSIAIASFDEHDLFRLHDPGITCIAQPIEEIARNVVDILVAEMQSEKSPVTQMILPSQLIIRGSSERK